MARQTTEKIGSKGRVTIPQKIRRAENLQQDDFVKLTVEKADLGRSPEEARDNMQKQGRPNPEQTSEKKNRDYNVFNG